MKSIKTIFVTMLCCMTVLHGFSQCPTSCTTTVSATTTAANPPVTAGQTFCVTSTGVVKGTVTLSGGTICNQGTIQATSFIANSGTINNYGSIIQIGSLELLNGSVLNNYNFIQVEKKFIVNPPAKYLTQNTQAVLWVFPFSATPLANPNASYAKLSRKVEAATYLASDGFLYFEYDEEYVAGTFKYTVYDNSRTPVMTNVADPLPVKAYGDNRYALKVACKVGMVIGDYVLEVTNDKNEISYLRFKVTAVQYCP